MATSYKNFKPIKFNQEEKCRAVVMSLINNEGKVENTVISQILRIPLCAVQDIRKQLETCGNLEAVIKKRGKAKDVSRTVREVEFINRVKDLFDEDPGRLMRSIS